MISLYKRADCQGAIFKTAMYHYLSENVLRDHETQNGIIHKKCCKTGFAETYQKKGLLLYMCILEF